MSDLKLDADGWPVTPKSPAAPLPLPPPVEDLNAAVHKELRRVRVETVRAPKGGKTPRLPTREELAALALDVYRLALDHKRAYVNKHGESHLIVQPDFRAACEALKVAAVVAGLNSANPQAETEARQEAEREAELDAESALERLRSNIAKRVMTVTGPKVNVSGGGEDDS